MASLVVGVVNGIVAQSLSQFREADALEGLVVWLNMQNANADDSSVLRTMNFSWINGLLFQTKVAEPALLHQRMNRGALKKQIPCTESR